MIAFSIHIFSCQRKIFEGSKGLKERIHLNSKCWSRCDSSINLNWLKFSRRILNEPKKYKLEAQPSFESKETQSASVREEKKELTRNTPSGDLNLIILPQEFEH